MKSLVLFSLLSMSLTAHAGMVCSSMESSFRFEVSGEMSLRSGTLSMAGYDLLEMECFAADADVTTMKCVPESLTDNSGLRVKLDQKTKDVTATITKKSKTVAVLNCSGN